MEEITDGPEEGFYEECGRDFILVKTHFPMGVNVLGGIYLQLLLIMFIPVSEGGMTPPPPPQGRMTPLPGVMFGSARAKQDQRRPGLLAEECYLCKVVHSC